MPAARSWREWTFWLIRWCSQDFHADFLDRPTVADVHGDKACDFYAADLALARPDQVVEQRGGDAREAWSIPDELTLHKSVRPTSQ